MDPSTRSSKRRKLEHSTPNSARTPNEGNGASPRQLTPRNRRTRSSVLRENHKEEAVGRKADKTDSELVERSSDARTEHEYSGSHTRSKHEDSQAQQEATVCEDTVEKDVDTPSKRPRSKPAATRKPAKAPQKQKSTRISQQADGDSKPNSATQAIREDGYISGLGNGEDLRPSPPLSPAQPEQPHSPRTADKETTLRSEEQNGMTEMEQPRLSGRQRRKSQKILDQEAAQSQAVKKSAKTVGKKSVVVQAKNVLSEVVSQVEAPNTTIASEDNVDGKEDKHKGTPATKSPPRSKKRRKISVRETDVTRYEVEPTDSRPSVGEEHEADYVSPRGHVCEGHEEVQHEDDMDIIPPVSRLSSPSRTARQSEDVENGILYDSVSKNSAPLASIEVSDSQIALLQRILLERITGQRPIPLTNLTDEYSKIHNLASQTVTAGEGNSLLVIGARGSGKTALVNTVVADLSKDHKEDFHVIRLNGFIQTDDKLALREIWRQLGREMEVEDEGETVGKNYADTLATLLALLSHPSELAGQETDAVAKSVVFVMDEFDLFAMHPRQTLLYNLFDIAQSRKAPVAVLGLTTRIDVAEALEKRVKSRWSHRYVHVPLAKSFIAFQQVVRAALVVETEQLSFEERVIMAGSEEKDIPASKRKGGKVNEPSQDVLAAWTSSVDVSFRNKAVRIYTY